MANKYLDINGVKVILDIMNEKDNAVKQLIPQPYDDTEIKERIEALEDYEVEPITEDEIKSLLNG